jgi:hypothetical protein
MSNRRSLTVSVLLQPSAKRARPSGQLTSFLVRPGQQEQFVAKVSKWAILCNIPFNALAHPELAAAAAVTGLKMPCEKTLRTSLLDKHNDYALETQKSAIQQHLVSEPRWGEEGGRCVAEFH